MKIVWQDMIWPLIVVGIVLIVLGISMMNSQVKGQTIDCEKTTYSEKWNTSYLRNITAICSNGGGD